VNACQLLSTQTVVAGFNRVTVDLGRYEARMIVCGGVYAPGTISASLPIPSMFLTSSPNLMRYYLG
jgi:hypothetical protein